MNSKTTSTEKALTLASVLAENEHLRRQVEKLAEENASLIKKLSGTELQGREPQREKSRT